MKSKSLVSINLLFLTLAFCSYISIKEGVFNIILFPIIFYLFGIAFIIFKKNKSIDKWHMNYIFNYGFIIRVISAIIIYYVLIQLRGVPFRGGGDAEGYERWGRLLSERWNAGQYIIPKMGANKGYFITSGIIHYTAQLIGRYHVLLPRFFNCFIGALIPVYVYKIAFRIYNENIAKTSAWISVFFPNFILYSSVQLKDIIIVFLFVVIIFKMLEYFYTDKLINILIIGAAVFILYYFREIFSILIIFVLVCTFFIYTFGKSDAGFNRGLYNKVVILTGTVALFIFIYFIGLEFGIVKFRSLAISARIDRYRYHSFGSFIGGEEYSESLALSLYSNMQGILRLIVFTGLLLIKPFPPWWALLNNQPLKIFYFINGMFWISILPFVIIGFITSIRKKFVESFPIYLIFIVVLIVVAATFFGYMCDRTNNRIPIITNSIFS